MTFRVRALLLWAICTLSAHSSCRGTDGYLRGTGTSSTIRFGQSKTPCPGSRIIPHPKDSRSAVSVIHQDITIWDLAGGSPLVAWNGSDLSNVHDVLVVDKSKVILLADDFGVSLRDLTTGKKRSEFDKPFYVRDLIYYTLGSSLDDRIAAATGLTKWPHKIPDATGLGISSEEWDDALSIQDQKLMLMDLEKGRVLGSLAFNDSFVHTVRFSPDRTFAVTISYLAITFWDIRNPSQIKLSKKINISELTAGQNPAQLIATAAISSDMRLAAASTDAGLFIVDLEKQKIATILPWINHVGIRLIRYLAWSADNRTVFGSDLQGSVTTWSVTPASVQFLKTYPLSAGGTNSQIFSTSTSGEPHPIFVVDPNLSYYIHPGTFHDEHTLGQCQGFEVVPL
jgi:hypothetical protein